VSDEAHALVVATASRTLALLQERAAALHAELATLQEELVAAQRTLSAPPPPLLEANEQLVLAALRAELLAETAVNTLGEVTRSSQRDALTGTPNRALMLDRIGEAIGMARRRGTRSAVLFCDLDNLKQINDTSGHDVGDAALQLAARRLESVVRESDSVSRHGGDEFVVLLSEVAQASDVAQIAMKMLAALSAPSRLGDHDVPLSASLGIAIFPEDGEDPATLITRADAAMYRSKKRGRGGFEFHSDAESSESSSDASVVDATAQAADA
jgi:diguanylate cyclase